MMAKKLLSAALSLIIMSGMLLFAHADSEVPDSFIPISTAEDLNNIRNNLDGNFILSNHIDMSGYSEWNVIGDYGSPFTGELNGNGYSIIGLNSKRSLLGWVENATIRNLGIVNCNIFQPEETASSSSAAGAFADNATNSSFEHCFASGNIQACVSVGWLSVKSYCSAGGLVGVAKNSSFINCYNTANINFIYDKITSAEIGGIVGNAVGSSFYCCYNTGNITTNCKIKKTENSTNVYNGGLVGASDESTVFDYCYYSDSIPYATGISQVNPIGTQDLENAKMKSQDFYIGFDFEKDWKAVSENYPHLVIEKPIRTQKVSVRYKGKTDINKFVIGGISSFASSDENIAFLSDDGYIHGLEVGEATITVFTKDNQTVLLEVDVSYNVWQKLIVFFLFGWIWY